MEENKTAAEPEEGTAERPGEIGVSTELEDKREESTATVQAELEEMKDKYLRLYAEFENYRKKVQKDKEELVKYANESLVYDLLPVMDNLEMALKHTMEGKADALQSLVQGVENTMREMSRTLEKSGLTAIEAAGQPFDPAYHHAMSQVEREDMESDMIAEEFRKGYRYKEKVLRPSLVAVSKKKS